MNFDGYLRSWVRAACGEWGYPEPEASYYERIGLRLPEGLRSLVAAGVREGVIIPAGSKFAVRGLAPGKGPYAWFSRRSAPREPSPNWEYFVQAAELVRLSRVAAAHGLRLAFEDHLMDLALYQDGRLVVCCEVKERASQIQDLATRIRTYQERIDFSRPDRGDDPLRKAKYIARRRPDFLALVAIGVRLEYRVTYPTGRAFELVRDVIPWA